MDKTLCDCGGCVNGEFCLHEGDRVVIAKHGLSDKDHYGLQVELREQGIWVQGQVGKQTTFLVSDGSRTSSSGLSLALKHGVPVGSSDQIRDLVANMTHGPRVHHKLPAQLFASDLWDRSVYVFALGEQARTDLDVTLRRHFAGIGRSIRSNLVAGVCTEGALASGNSKILKSIGVPVFSINSFLSTINLSIDETKGIIS
jgi:hypothetical protein